MDVIHPPRPRIDAAEFTADLGHIEDAPRGKRVAMIKALAARLGVHYNTIYNKLRERRAMAILAGPYEQPGSESVAIEETA